MHELRNQKLEKETEINIELRIKHQNYGSFLLFSSQFSCGFRVTFLSTPPKHRARTHATNRKQNNILFTPFLSCSNGITHRKFDINKRHTHTHAHTLNTYIFAFRIEIKLILRVIYIELYLYIGKAHLIKTSTIHEYRTHNQFFFDSNCQIANDCEVFLVYCCCDSLRYYHCCLSAATVVAGIICM